MTKTKTEKNPETMSFDTREAAGQLRSFTEKGIEQSKQAYASLKNGSEEARKALESSYEAVRANSSDLSLKAITTLRTNTEAGFTHLEALINARSLSEVVELQTSFLRQSFEETIAQARDYQSVATKAAENIAQPIKLAVEKAFKSVNAA